MRLNRALTIAVSLVVVVATTAEARDVRIKWRFAGWLLQNVAQVAAENSPPSGVTLVQVRAKGAPGAATIQAFAGRAGRPAPAGDLSGCFTGATVKVIPTDNVIVATLEDLSLLYGTLNLAGNNFLCIDPASGKLEGRLEMQFTGGTGRFEGATGTGVITAVVRPVTSGSNLSAETGELVGTVRVP